MAGRPRLPNSVAESSGAAIKDPQRFRDRASPAVSPLGKAPSHLSGPAKKAWDMLASEIPWLSSADRVVVEAAAHLRARMMTEPDCPVNVFAQLRLCMSSLGATPVDRSKITVDDDGQEDGESYLN